VIYSRGVDSKGPTLVRFHVIKKKVQQNQSTLMV